MLGHGHVEAKGQDVSSQTNFESKNGLQWEQQQSTHEFVHLELAFVKILSVLFYLSTLHFYPSVRRQCRFFNLHRLSTVSPPLSVPSEFTFALSLHFTSGPRRKKEGRAREKEGGREREERGRVRGTDGGTEGRRDG